MTQKEINNLADFISKNTGGSSSIFVAMTPSGQSVVISAGEPSDVANAMFSSIADPDAKNDLYRIIKDTMFNLFKYDDSYRSDFFKDMMLYCSTKNNAN